MVLKPKHQHQAGDDRVLVQLCCADGALLENRQLGAQYGFQLEMSGFSGLSLHVSSPTARQLSLKRVRIEFPLKPKPCGRCATAGLREQPTLAAGTPRPPRKAQQLQCWAGRVPCGLHECSSVRCHMHHQACIARFRSLFYPKCMT